MSSNFNMIAKQIVTYVVTQRYIFHKNTSYVYSIEVFLRA